MTSTIEARRRMHRATVLTAVIAIAPVSLVIVAMTSESWLQGLLLAAGLSLAFLVFYDWNDDRRPSVVNVALALGFSYLVWIFCAVSGLNPLGFFGMALLGGILVPRVHERQIPAAVGLGGLSAATGLLYFLDNPFTWSDVALYVLMPGGLTVFISAVIVTLERHRTILLDLERAQSAEAELAIMRERIRFAGDLHDIQGHTLHVVNLKVALAQELLRSDPERAAAELREVYAQVEDTIARSKDLAYGHRRLNLSAELENARNLFDAAGVRVRLERTGEVDDWAGELLGQVLREATTNILRHSQATAVGITVSGSSIEVTNDGAAGSSTPDLSGLAVLADRLTASGGELTAAQEDGRFVTAARFPVGSHTGAREEPVR